MHFQKLLQKLITKFYVQLPTNKPRAPSSDPVDHHFCLCNLSKNWKHLLNWPKVGLWLTWNTHKLSVITLIVDAVKRSILNKMEKWIPSKSRSGSPPGTPIANVVAHRESLTVILRKWRGQTNTQTHETVKFTKFSGNFRVFDGTTPRTDSPTPFHHSAPRRIKNSPWRGI